MSHLLQHNGILNHIARDSHIIQLGSGGYFDESNFRFQKRSVAKAEVLTYKGFCSKCDNQIFQSIEKVAPNFNEYKTRLLFSYRAFLSEYSRILYALEAYSEFVACKELSPEIKARSAPVKRRGELQLNFYNYYLKIFEKELKVKSNKSPLILFSPRRHFEFHTLEIPKIEVAASAVFSYAEDVPMTKDEYDLIKPLNAKTASYIKPFFINIIPKENSSVIILGYAKGAAKLEFMPVSQIDKLSTKAIYKLISDILIKRIDHWCISVPFFDKMKKVGKDKKVIDLKHEYFTYPLSNLRLFVDMDLEFNLFGNSKE